MAAADTGRGLGYRRSGTKRVKSGTPFGPGQFFEDTAQTNDVVGVSLFGQRRLAGAQQGEPVEDVRITAELPQGTHAGVLGIEIVQKVAPGALIIVR